MFVYGLCLFVCDVSFLVACLSMCLSLLFWGVAAVLAYCLFPDVFRGCSFLLCVFGRVCAFFVLLVL